MLTQVSWCKVCEAYIFLLFFFSYLWKKRKKRYAMIRKTNERKSIEQFLQKTPERIWDCPLIWYRKVLHDDRSDHQRNYPKNSRFVFFFYFFSFSYLYISYTYVRTKCQTIVNLKGIHEGRRSMMIYQWGHQ